MLAILDEERNFTVESGTTQFSMRRLPDFIRLVMTLCTSDQWTLNIIRYIEYCLHP